MADRDAQQELKKRARRRLVGATALALAAAIILPMVMDQEPQPPGQDIQIRIPDRNAGQGAPLAMRSPSPPGGDASGSAAGSSPRSEGESSSKPVQAAPSAPAAPTSAPATPTEATKAAAESKPDAKPAEAPKAKSEGKAPEAKAPEAKGEPAAGNEEAERVKAILSGSTEFVVQLGVFSEAANARKIQARAKAQGYNSFTEAVDTSKGRKTRVRAGPFATREAAEQALEKLRKSGLNGIVAPKA